MLNVRRSNVRCQQIKTRYKDAITGVQTGWLLSKLASADLQLNIRQRGLTERVCDSCCKM